MIPLYFEGCETSNYDDSQTDGALATTGWFMDANGTKVGDTFPTRLARDHLIRSWSDTWFSTGGSLWHEPTGLWSNYPTNAGATLNSPVCYKLSTYQQFLDDENRGYDYADEHPQTPALCIQQPNLYLGPSEPCSMDPSDPCRAIRPPRVLETLDEGSLRVFRHEIESCIDSNGGNLEGTLAPWMGLAHEVGATSKFMRDLLCMYRSHKVPEIVGFTGLSFDPTGSVASRNVSAGEWQDTQRVFDEVYSPWIADYSRALGTIPTSDSVTVVPDKLEYVLKSSGVTAQTVDLGSVLSSGKQMTVLEVDFKGLVNSENKGYFSTHHTDSVTPDMAYGYLVNLECSIVPPASGFTGGAYGQVQVYDWLAHDFVDVRVIDSVEDESEVLSGPRPRGAGGTTYGFYAGTAKTIRMSLDVRSPVNALGYPTREYVSTASTDGFDRGMMRLRFKHVGNNAQESFVSKYDLVQVAPFTFTRTPSINGGPQATHKLPVSGGLVTGPSGYGGGPSYGYTPYSYEPVDLVNFPHAPEYYANSTIARFGGPMSLWEPSYLDTVTCTPIHYSDWHYHVEGPASLGHLGQWPTGYDADSETIADTRLVTSRFNLPADALDSEGKVVKRKQQASAHFTLPIWTDAPDEATAGVAAQPYQVWYWITRSIQWANVTEGVDVQISRDPSDLNREVVISSRATEPFQAGYYALTLNLTPPAASGEQYAAYCSGTPEAPGAVLRSNATVLKWDENLEDFVSMPVVQYNFRIYPDCNDDGLIDSYEAQCNFYNGSDCPADVDDGSGTGTLDAGVDINDLLYFLAQFELGLSGADLDNGMGTGMPDQAVDINDLLFFLAHFELGC